MIAYIAVILVVLLGLVTGAPPAHGQEYPTKPVRIITQAVASANDFIARLVAQGLTNGLGQQVIVENQPSYPSLGVSVAKAPPDGYTLLAGGSPIWTLPLLQKMPYEPMTDFAPISSTSRSLNVLVIHPSLPAKSVKELIALAKAKPGELNYASGGAGGSGHLTGELFNAMAGVRILHIPYKGGSAALNELLAGQVQMTFDNPSTVIPLTKVGRLRALAVTSAEPSELVPGLPTVAASGLPGFEATQTTGVFAPAKTPESIIKRLNQEIVRTLSSADAKDRYLQRGIEVLPNSPAAFAAVLKKDVATWSKVIKDANIKTE